MTYSLPDTAKADLGPAHRARAPRFENLKKKMGLIL